jgi:dipeptidyl aminopeptidase/acylaminoacyl peptidase
LASADYDGVLTLWEPLPPGEWRPRRRLSQRPAGFALTPDGKSVVVSADDGSLTLYNTANGKKERALDAWDRAATALRASPDGRLLAGWDGTGAFGLWDLATGKRRPAPPGTPLEVSGAAFSADGKTLALGYVCGLHLREAATGKLVQRLDGPGYGLAWPVAWSADGRALAAGISNRRLLLFERGRERVRWLGEGGEVGALAFSPDGRLLAAARGGRSVRLYEILTGQEVRDIEEPAGYGLALAFSADGRTLAVGGGTHVGYGTLGYHTGRTIGHTPDFRIALCDVGSGRRVHALAGHSQQVNSLAFTPDGATLVSGGADHTVLAWDVAAFTGRTRRPAVTLNAEKRALLWDFLAGDAARAQSAVAEMIEAPGTAVPLVAKALPPASEVAPEKLRAWIADLDHDEYERRERASRELERQGGRAEPAVRAALEAKPPPEARRRLEQLLEHLAEGSSPEWRRSVRALQVLEAVGTPEARRVLGKLAGGLPEDLLTREARESLQRLERRPLEP